MSKEDIFSKIQIKDYNNVLENVLEAKDFSEDAKNLLLSMLYKIENGYEDYKTIKVNCTSKKYFLKNIVQIIEKECDQIEFVKPLSEQSKELEEKKVNFIVEDKKIKVYQNERMLLEALVSLSHKDFYINEQYKLFEPAIRKTLILGNIMSNSEVIRDFNGWSWGITPSQLINKNINIIYQNLLILFGNNLMQKWITNDVEQEEIDLPNNEILRSKYNNNFGITKEEMKEEKEDYIAIMKEILEQKCGEENAKVFFEKLLSCILVVGSNIDKEQKRFLLEKQKEIEEELEKMNDNKKYVEDISRNKKDITEKIKQIDTLLNDENLLKDEFFRRNEKLPTKEKIFSVSHLVIMLEKEREKYLEEIKINNKKMEPNEFVKNKHEFEKQKEFYSNLNLSKEKETSENIQIEELQKAFLNCIKEIVNRVESKEEIEKILYEVRYYEHIPYNYENISSIEYIKEQLEELENTIIQKACGLKILTTFSENKELNIKILKFIFKCKISNLKNVIFVLKYHKGILKIVEYDVNTEEEVMELQITEKVELSVKLNKKIKVYE